MYIDTNAGKIYVNKTGQGSPLLLLHGNGEDHTIFQTILPYFEQRFTVYRMDTRAHGLSEFSLETLTFERITQDILELLKAEKIQRIPVIGYSDGGNIALYLAAHYPAVVESVITMGANFEEDGLLEESYQEILQEREQIQRIPDKQIRKHKLAIVNLMLDELVLSAVDLQHIQAPVLVMAGEEDVVKKEHTEEMARFIPQSDLLFVPRGGHDFFVDQPEALTEAATLFYKKIRKK